MLYLSPTPITTGADYIEQELTTIHSATLIERRIHPNLQSSRLIHKNGQAAPGGLAGRYYRILKAIIAYSIRLRAPPNAIPCGRGLVNTIILVALKTLQL